MKKDVKQPKFNTKNVTKINFKSREVRKILSAMKKENRQIGEASKVDTSRLTLRFET